MNDSKNAQLPPLPIENQTPSTTTSLVASIARSAVTQSSIIFTSLGREFLLWWFRFPIKLFRPYAVNPYQVYHQMAKGEGLDANLSYLIKNSSWKLWKAHVLPLLAINSAIGFILFNTYTFSLWKLNEFNQNTLINPFMAGFAAGASQSVFANPLNRIQQSWEADALVMHKDEGVLALFKKSFRKLPKGLDKIKFLYKNFQLNFMRDSISFSIFFGSFYNFSKFGKDYLDNHPPNSAHSKHYSKRLAHGLFVVGAGGFAGICYQTFVYPLDSLVSKVRLERSDSFTRLETGMRIVRRDGIRSLYKGMTQSLFKVVPASAIGLFVFEMLQ